jgi:hypothetical protein
MSDTPELDDLKAIAKAAVAVGEALQRTRDELNRSSDPVDEAGAAGCRDLISHLAGDIRAATKTPLEIVEKRLTNAVLIVIYKKT